MVLALVVAGFLFVTPHLPSALYFSRAGATVDVPGNGALSLFSLAAGACIVSGVLLAKRSPLLATGLTLLPFLVVPWWHAFVWGWLLGTIIVAMLAATVAWHRAVAPYAASLMIGIFYSGTHVPTILPIGFVTAGNTQGSRLLVFALYTVAITATVAISARVRALESARRC